MFASQIQQTQAFVAPSS